MLEADIATRVTGYTAAGGGVSLTDANVIVSGGRGVSNNPRLTPPAGMDEKQAEVWRAQQGFKLVGELASTLGAAMGASRSTPVIFPHQVGQTGRVISPDLYRLHICAIQHLAGMRPARYRGDQ
jgi:electron transfer flavoprotein alpha subunit